MKCARDAVRFKGQPIGSLAPGAIVRMGLAMVPEGRRLFPSLSVEENLLMGAFAKRPGPWDLKRLFALFPILEQKRRAPATSLSGGQQQMVAIGRALMGNPGVLLCDELSLGLAPIVIKEIYEAVPALTREGTSLVIVEQDVSVAQRVSQRVVCFQEGRVSLEGCERCADARADQSGVLRCLISCVSGSAARRAVPGSGSCCRGRRCAPTALRCSRHKGGCDAARSGAERATASWLLAGPSPAAPDFPLRRSASRRATSRRHRVPPTARRHSWCSVGMPR